MILNVWRPISKSINKRQVIVRYDICDIDDIYKNGSTGLKIIYKCDGNNCKFPNKIHSIQRYHLNINRSVNMHEKLQICKSCQTSGDKNPKFGDKRTWEELMGKEKSREMKDRYRCKFTGANNPSKLDVVKRKKNQVIINFKNVSGLVESFRYELNRICGDNKFAMLTLVCDKNHTFDMSYQNFKRGHRCKFCYYESIKIPLDKIKNFEKYSMKVRCLTRSVFSKNHNIIDPLELKLKNSGLYHIDHIYSVADGFRNNIDPVILSSLVNLRVIRKYENLEKGMKSDIKLEELIERYNNTTL